MSPERIPERPKSVYKDPMAVIRFMREVVSYGKEVTSHTFARRHSILSALNEETVVWDREVTNAIHYGLPFEASLYLIRRAHAERAGKRKASKP